MSTGIRLAFSCLIVGSVALAPGRVDVDDFVVQNTADSGSGSLRQAILDANASVLPATINFANNLGTILLQQELPAITNSVTMNGGTGNIVSGAGQSRIFFVDAPGASVEE